MKVTHLLPFLLAPMVCLAQARPAPGDSRTAKLYDMGELVSKPPGPDLVLRPAQSAPAKRPALGLSVPNPFTQTDIPVGAEAIARLARAFIKPKLRSNEEINPVGERWIVVLGRPKQHAWIERFLASARGDQTQPVSIDCRCLSMPEVTFLRQIRPALLVQSETAEVDGVQPPAAEVSYLTEVLAPGAATNAFLEGLLGNADVQTVTNHTLQMLPLHIAHIATVNQTAYVRDFEVKVTKDAVIANPIVDVVQDGIMMQAAIAPLETGLLGLSLDVTFTDLERPIPEFKTKLGLETEVSIQLPNLRSTRLEAAVELKADHIVVMAPPPMGGRRILFVVTVRPHKAAQPKDKKKVYER